MRLGEKCSKPPPFAGRQGAGKPELPRNLANHVPYQLGDSGELGEFTKERPDCRVDCHKEKRRRYDKDQKGAVLLKCEYEWSAKNSFKESGETNDNSCRALCDKGDARSEDAYKNRLIEVESEEIAVAAWSLAENVDQTDDESNQRRQVSGCGCRSNGHVVATGLR